MVESIADLLACAVFTRIGMTGVDFEFTLETRVAMDTSALNIARGSQGTRGIVSKDQFDALLRRDDFHLQTRIRRTRSFDLLFTVRSLVSRFTVALIGVDQRLACAVILTGIR